MSTMLRRWLLSIAALAVGAASTAFAGDACGDACCVKCCARSCGQRDQQAPRMVPFAPFGPVVESVPLLANPVLLAQDRLVVSATQLRDLGIVADARTRHLLVDQRLSAGRTAEPRGASLDDRLAKVEQDIKDLEASLEQLLKLVKQQDEHLRRLSPPGDK
jgi:hypothetical protein